MTKDLEGAVSRARNQLVAVAAMIFLSMAFYVSAEDALSGKNIFEDPDGDGLSTEEEKLYGTNASVKDTDGDGYSDGVEVRGGYDPTKPAPGDRIIPVETDARTTSSAAKPDQNMTVAMSQEIAKLIEDTKQRSEEGEDSDITPEQLQALVDKVTSGDVEDVTLPTIDVESIKVKRQDFGKISAERRKEKIHDDIMEYVTAMGYIIANNSPQKVSSVTDMYAVLGGEAESAVRAMTAWDMNYFDEIENVSEKMLEEIGDVEVPPQMLDIHVRSLQVMVYAKDLKSEMPDSKTDDPLYLISEVSRAQALLSVTMSLKEDIDRVFNDYDIDESDIKISL